MSILAFVYDVSTAIADIVLRQNWLIYKWLLLMNMYTKTVRWSEIIRPCGVISIVVLGSLRQLFMLCSRNKGTRCAFYHTLQEYRFITIIKDSTFYFSTGHVFNFTWKIHYRREKHNVETACKTLEILIGLHNSKISRTDNTISIC